MAKWTDLKGAVAEVIKTNGNQEITGQVLQNVLNTIISNLGENATYAGIAIPTTNPGTPDGPVFYFAFQPGTYSNFNANVISEKDNMRIFYWNGTDWNDEDTGVPNSSMLSSYVNNVAMGTINVNISGGYSELDDYNSYDKKGWYCLSNNGALPGTHLLVTGDDWGHVVHQFLFGDYVLDEEGDISGHNDGQPSILIRTYNINSSTITDPAKGTWSKWRQFPEIMQTTGDSQTSVMSQAGVTKYIENVAMGTINVNIGGDYSELDSYNSYDKKGLYCLSSGGELPGTHLLVTGDDWGHVVHQFLFGDYVINEEGEITGHQDGTPSILIRTYNINSSTISDPAKGTWSKWRYYQDTFINKYKGTLFTILYGIAKNTGNVSLNADYISTDFIPISKDDTIRAGVTYTTSQAGIAFYDEKFEFISYVQHEDASFVEMTITGDDIPENAAYIKCTLLKSNIAIGYVYVEKAKYINSRVNWIKSYLPNIGLTITGLVSSTVNKIATTCYIPIGIGFNIFVKCSSSPERPIYVLYDKYYNPVFISAEKNVTVFKHFTYEELKRDSENAAYIRISVPYDPDNNILPYIINLSADDIIGLDSNIREYIGKDMFVNKGLMLRKSDGQLVENSLYNSTDYIEIDKTVPIIARAYEGPTQTAPIVFYDADFNFISYVTGYNNISTIYVSPEDIPDNAKYMRATGISSEQGDDTQNFLFNGLSLYSLYKSSIKIGNLFTFKEQFVHRNTGILTNNPLYMCTDFIPITKADILVHGYEGPSSVAACCFYDKDRNFISSFQSNKKYTNEHRITINAIPENAAYIRCSASIDDEYAGVFSFGINISAILTNMNNLYDKIETLEGGLKDQNIIMKASAWEAEGKAREQYLRQAYLDSGEPAKWYGVEWKEEDNADNVVAINSTGDDELHTTLPIQSKMRRCVTKNCIVQYYLDEDNSEKKEDGSNANLDGTDGNVMVEIPEFFYRCEEEINDGVKTVRLKISEQGLPGFVFSRKRYTSAYEATVDRNTNKLASVCTTKFTRNTETISTRSNNYVVGTERSLGEQKTAYRNGFTSNAANYRGGTNDSSLDNENTPTNKNYARNQLGIPVANVNRTDCRAYADPLNGMFMYQYDTQKAIWILAQIEYKTRHIQKSIASGGLGMGATVYPNYNAYEAFFQPQRGISCIPCGITNVLGNKSGEVYYRMVNVPIASTGSGQTIEYTEWGDLWMPVMSYRGIENFYGHIYKIVDQVNLFCENTGEYIEGHEDEYTYRIFNNTYYYEPNPYLTNDIADESKCLGTYKFCADIMCVKNLLLGRDAHILHIGTSSDKDYTKNYCDCSEYNNGTKMKFITFNGRIVSLNLVGFHFIVGFDNADGSSTRPSDGTRLDHF